MEHSQKCDKQAVGLPFDEAEDFEEITYTSAREKYANDPQYWHAAHAMFFAREPDRILWGGRPNLSLKATARIMMQSRFDGNLGFPGGLMDKGPETVVEALNRELVEEINLDIERFSCTQENLMLTNVNQKKKLVTYFYVKELSLSEFDEVERRVLGAVEWGTETYGVIRVPLFTMSDGFRGFPVFLANRFAGNARSQLLTAIAKKGILPKEDVLAAYEKYMKLRYEKDIFKCDD